MKKIVILNPDYDLRNDKDRILLFTKKNKSYDSSPEWYSFIHPIQARALCHFLNNNTFEQNCLNISKETMTPLVDVIKIMSGFVNNPNPFYTIFMDQKIFWPKNILIEISEEDYINIPTYDINTEIMDCETVSLVPDRLHLGPMSILFMLTNKCVTHCKYCYADKGKPYKSLDLSDVYKIIDNAKRLKVQEFDIIGGEIFCRPDWDLILNKLVENGMMPNYISTKVPITENIIKRLKRSGYNNVIQLSLDSIFDHTLGQIIGSHPGYVDSFLKGLNLLQLNNFKIQITTILTNLNSSPEQIHALYQTIKEVSNLIYWEIRVPQMSLYNVETFKMIKASRKELENIVSWIRKNIIPNANFQIRISAEELDTEYQNEGCGETFGGGKCEMLKRSCFILPDGKVTICEQLYWHPRFIIGDLTKQTIEEVWSSSRAQELINMSNSLYRSESKCKKCISFDSCNLSKRRCYVRIMQAYGFENWDYPDPHCVHAPAVKSDLKYH